MASTAQRNFSGGELAPTLHARTDQEKYATGLAKCLNFIVQRHGGVQNRPGWALVAQTKDGGKARLLEFVFSPDPTQVYVLEFGHLYMRVHHGGAPIVVTGVAAWATATAYAMGDLVANGGVNYYAIRDHTSDAPTEPGVGGSTADHWYPLDGDTYEIPTPYDVTELAEIQYVQSGDVITLVHRNHPVTDLYRTGHTAWRLSETSLAAKIATPANPTALGTEASTDPVFWAITAVDELGNESLPAIVQENWNPTSTDPVSLDWDPVDGAVQYLVYRSMDGVNYGRIELAFGVNAQSSDDVWESPTSDVSTMDEGNYVASGTVATNVAVPSAAEKSASGKYTLTFDLTLNIDDPYTSGAAEAIAFYKRDAEAPVSLGPIALTNSVGTQQISVEVTVPDNGYSTLEFQLQAGVYSDSYGSPPPITWEAIVTGVSVTWARGSTGASDLGNEADFDYGPPATRSLFLEEGDYPSVVTNSQQRQWLASTNSRPETVWGSRTGDYHNFSISMPLRADDSVEFTPVGRQVNEVQHLLDLDEFYVFTTTRILRIDGDESGAITPMAISPRQVSGHGASDLAPIVVTNAALYMQARGGIPRDFRPGTDRGDQDRDLSLFASHLFDGYTIVSWAYQEIPQSVVWAVRSDGVLLGLTYLREHEIWAWHRHTTIGSVEDVVVVPEGQEDAVYLIVSRMVGGVATRFVERMTTRTQNDLSLLEEMIFMDGAVTYDGRDTSTAATVFTGLDHLEGAEVAVVADGVVISSPLNPNHSLDGGETLAPVLTVVGGSVTIPTPALLVHVGLPYMADLETLDIDTASGASPKSGPHLNVTKVGVSLERSRGLWVGEAEPVATPLEGMELLPVADVDEGEVLAADEIRTTTTHVTIEGRYDSNGRIFLRQPDPSPVTILAVFPQGFLPSPS